MGGHKLLVLDRDKLAIQIGMKNDRSASKKSEMFPSVRR